MRVMPITRSSTRIVRSSRASLSRPKSAVPAIAATTAPAMSASTAGVNGATAARESDRERMASDAAIVVKLTARFRGTACRAE